MLWKIPLSIKNKNITSMQYLDLGERYEPNYVIANEFGHRVIKSGEMAELMSGSSNPEEFQRLCDRAIGWAN
jgi:hypothetical protein